MNIRLLILGLLATLLTGCSLEDDRDECCGVTLHFRYMETGQDEFQSNIRSMRHFLFDSNGIFITEILVPQTTNKVLIQQIDNGQYTMITVANSTTVNTAFSELIPRESLLSDFQLYLADSETRTSENGLYDNADELFYNATVFTVTESDRDFYFEDLSNVHCHLHVYLYWHKLPDYRGTFTMKLFDVPADFSLSPDSMMRVKTLTDDDSLEPSLGNSVQLVPVQMERLIDHQIEVMPYNFKLMGEFITHRWTNKSIPILQVFNGDDAVTRQIPLKEVFDNWNISPDSDPVQDYWLEIEVYPDGTSYVGKYMSGKVNGWIDGGKITG